MKRQVSPIPLLQQARGIHDRHHAPFRPQERNAPRNHVAPDAIKDHVDSRGEFPPDGLRPVGDRVVQYPIRAPTARHGDGLHKLRRPRRTGRDYTCPRSLGKLHPNGSDSPVCRGNQDRFPKNQLAAREEAVMCGSPGKGDCGCLGEAAIPRHQGDQVFRHHVEFAIGSAAKIRRVKDAVPRPESRRARAARFHNARDIESQDKPGRQRHARRFRPRGPLSSQLVVDRVDPDGHHPYQQLVEAGHRIGDFRKFQHIRTARGGHDYGFQDQLLVLAIRGGN